MESFSIGALFCHLSSLLEGLLQLIECFCFFIILLQLWKLQSHTFIVGNVKTIVSYFALEKVIEFVQLGKNNYSIYEDLIEKKEITCQKARYFG